MEFVNAEAPLTENDLARVESELRITFPESVRHCYLEANGGEPEPYVFSNDQLDTIVAELLPLQSTTTGTSVECYRRLVMESRLVSTNLFPFAVDGGGDYFFVDCSDPAGKVFFYRSDTSQEDRLLDLGVGFAEFWNALQPE